MICGNCGAANDGDARFCDACGAALQAGCPNCGAANKPGARFCKECGSALASGSPATAASAGGGPAPASVAERRLVTVLFADIVGFTPFAEERDAEEVRDTLTRYFDLCSEIVRRYGGTVEKFIGDAVMAVWGAPTTHEDDAERAVRAGLELVDSVQALGGDIRARAGLMTGEAAVTLGATNQGMVAGDLVNTASRLQSVASPGSVLVGEATMRASDAAVAYERAGEQMLKGKQAPVPAWRALRVVAERRGANRTDQLEAPFVGRSNELRLVKDLFHAAGREHQPHLLSVMGLGGIGKSRLAWEFFKYVDGLVEQTYWHQGRCPAYGDGVTFWALGEMVRRRCGLVETDDEATTRAKVTERVAEFVADPEQRQWVERALLTLLGTESGMSPDQLFAAWRTFFEHVAEHGTVVMVFEDLQHADPGLLDFIDHLLEWTRERAIFVVTLARPELLERRPAWGAGKRRFSSIYLEPLSDAEMRELLAGLVPGLPDRVAAAIVARAEGVPLYAVETVRMLLADGRLRQDGERYVPAGELNALAVPETLSALIASRLDALEEADRDIVHSAAVLGQSFTAEALAAIEGVGAAELEPHLATLVRREILRRDVDPRSPEQGQYLFVQALVREVAYKQLAKKDRRKRHLAAARHFEQVESDELASVLAGHYLAAYENTGAGPEADALRAQARIALHAAAERAARLGAYPQATQLTEQAIAIAVEPLDTVELHEQAGEHAKHAGRFDLAEEHLRAAMQLSEAGDDRAGAALATALLGDTLLDARRNQPGLALLERAVDEYADVVDPDVVAHLKCTYARALSQNEMHQQALVVVDQALELAEHENLARLLGAGLQVRGATLSSLGRTYEGVALLHAAEQLARERGFDELLSNTLTILTLILGETDSRAAWENAREALDLARRTGRRDGMYMAINNIGYEGFLAGDWDNALDELDTALADELDPGNHTWLLSNSIIVHACRGEDVGEQLAVLERLVREGNEPERELAARDARANAAFAAGDLAGARSEWRLTAETAAVYAPAAFYEAGRCSVWARDLDGLRKDLADIEASGVHGRTVEIRRTTLLAGLAALEGRTAEALSLYVQALDEWRDVGQAWNVALTGIDAVSVLDPAEPRVREIAQSTREILVRVGARPFIERLDAALARAPVATAGVGSTEVASGARAPAAPAR